MASYAWDFAGLPAGAGVTVPHSYAGAGTYKVTLTVTDTAGARSVSVQNVTVDAQPLNDAPEP